MNEGGRIQSGDASRVSLVIGIIIAVLAIAVVLYFVVFAHSVKETMTGFDPNRPLPDDATLRKRLSPEQYHVVRENGTETAFKNKLWDNFRPGIYVDIITREPLFSSVDKFDGGTGRPTFGKPLSKDLIVERDDNSYDMHRVEVRAKRSNAHLGHLIQDPTSPTGKRYAINSAALYFIPTEDMEHAGYAAFLSLVPPVAQK
ncbi:MAG TPA: peptide-methionine (R)-S-oxide reductase MsrB [Chthoniobacterales bacterium]|jgi:peptide methionine sulfoxide reductase msrA/msrB|nr:peptide-methionine (R)-S-oxide reductase MsrB [Chthoniobacterales bacterium]